MTQNDKQISNFRQALEVRRQSAAATALSFGSAAT
jgi:hypothetical protein